MSSASTPPSAVVNLFGNNNRKYPPRLPRTCNLTKLPIIYRWHNVPDTDEWRCVLHGRLLSLKQDPTHLYYRTYRTAQSPKPKINDDDTTLSLLTHYFNLSANLTSLYTEWSAQDPNFRKKAPQFTGIRILRQDAWEALISFICSSNNNIARISQMVEKLCLNYGPFIASINGRAYHGFPAPDALTAHDVEGKLRGLGFGYRAKYIYQTAVMVAKERESGWLDSLCNPEEGYREAHEKLLELQGVGPKVADCVCLMGLGWGEAVPVDTHVWQIAQRDYKFGKGGNKSLTKVTYDAVGNHFRKLWGKEAGWAHSVLFTADLRTFSDRLAATTSKKVDVKVEKDDKEGVEVETKVTTAIAVPTKRPIDEEGVKAEEEDETKEKEKLNTIVQASQTTTARRMSKRLRKK
ncbi:uncharacterized protein An07g02890 [Aspergillus niger]|uniref:N-glycosylase/DNA lyase n=2 Tax=Aspergillus niger TaxID=5061 RepID=A2QMP9_ASPNC|nr:uncharacterized protein An07g02890 [Aspergillus niger]CAL00223.1 unnamed protein product [Aspergillus niger]